MIKTVLDEKFMIRTAYPEIYDELCEVKKIFKLRIHLFSTSLAIGVLYDRKTTVKPKRDIIRLSQLRDRAGEWNLGEQKELIDILVRICCTHADRYEIGSLMLSYADGGLEKLYQDFQEQGILDLSRLLEEAKLKWTERLEELLKGKI